MRKALAAFVIVILLINLFGNFISFIAERYAIRSRNIQSTVSNVRTFEFTSEEFRKLDKRNGDAELYVDGSMYDILQIRCEKDKIIVEASFDGKETNLLHNFLSLFESEYPEENSESNKILSFHLLEFTAGCLVFTIFNTPNIFKVKHADCNLLAAGLVVQSPPPDVILSR